MTESEMMKADWVKFVTTERDMFLFTYAGYWMRGVKHDADLGWLVWEGDGDIPFDTEPNRDIALDVWPTEENLPVDWYRINKVLAEEAWDIGVDKYGEFWYDEGDADMYDNVLQLALLGEIRYG